MKARLYLRVSTDEQARHGLSLDTQMTELKQYCELNNYTIVKTYADEGISGGSIKKRKAFTSMINDAKPGEIILFTKLDRFSRNLLDALLTIKTLQEKNVSVKAIQQDIDTTTTQGKTMLQMMLVIAENEREMTSDRINSVFADRFKKGYSVSGKVPLGYKKIDGKYTIDEKPAEAIRNLFDRYNRTGNLFATLQWWNETYPEYTTSYQQLKKYRLRNSIYVGIHPSGLNDNFCDPIVEPKIYESVQQKLNRNISTRKKTKYVYLFSKLIFCSECKRVMTGNANTTNKEPFYLYRCNHAYLDKQCDNRHIVSETKIEQYLLNILTEMNDNKSNFVIKKKKSPNLQKRIEAVQNQLFRLQDLYIDGSITKERFDSKYTELNSKLEKMKNEDNSSLTVIETVLKKYTDASLVDLYNDLDREHKQQFWHTVIDKIYFDGKDYEIIWKKE